MDLTKLSFNIANILGSSSSSINQISHAQGCLIYTAGSYLIFYSPVLDQQIGYIKHRSASISCIAVSQDQKLLAVAQRGKYPLICIYEIQNLEKLNGNETPNCRQLKGHKYSIDLLTFSPDNRYLLSLSNHDGSMFLWQNSQTVARNRITKAVNKIFFDHNGDLVTLGRGYFKLWKFQKGQAIRKKQEDVWMLEGKVLTFGKKFNTKQFIDAALYLGEENQNNSKVILLSNDGLLCVMQGGYQKVQKWIDLMMTRTTGLQIAGNLALCTGDNALIKAIDLIELNLKGKFPKPPPTNKQNIAKDQVLQYNENEQFPQCWGVKKVGEFVVTLYENKTMFIWKIQNQIRAIRSIITHRQKINSVCLLQQIRGDISFFSTVSEDNTLRIWHFYKKQFAGNRQSIDVAEIIGIKRNVYCKNLTRIIYTDSQHPIIRMKLYQKKSIACISKYQFLLYSLDNFQLLLHDSFEDEPLVKGSTAKKQLLSLDTLDDLIYIGNDVGQLKVYRPQEQKLCKLKQIQMQMPIESLQIFNKRILAYGKGRLKCISLQNQVLLNQYNIECCAASNNYIILCEKKMISLYSLGRSKKTASLTIAHQLDQHQNIRMVRSNSWLIAVVTSRNRIVICNFSATVLYSEELSQVVADFEVTEGGEVLIIGQGGTVVIKKQQNSSKYHRIDQQVKKWFQLNDMSWMDGSVWANSRNKSNSSLAIKSEDKLSNIAQQESVRMPLPQQLLGSVNITCPQLPNVALQYKNQDNKKSIFNPSSICAQVNKIYNDVNELMKNRNDGKKVTSPRFGNNNEIQLTQSVDQMNFQSQGSQKQKRRIFGDGKQKQKLGSPYQPKFTNNLVESVMNTSSKQQPQPSSTKDNQNVNNSQDTINFGFSQFKEERPSIGQSPKINQSKLLYTQTEKKPSQSEEFVTSVKLMNDSYEMLKGKRQHIQSMIIEHSQNYQHLYQLLDTVYGEQKRKKQRKTIADKYKQLSQTFISDICPQFKN